MYVEAISVVDADIARAAADQAHLTEAQGEEVPISSGKPSDVQRGHAAVAAAEAALAQTQAALNAAEAAQSAPASSSADTHAQSTMTASTHMVDTVT